MFRKYYNVMMATSLHNKKDIIIKLHDYEKYPSNSTTLRYLKETKMVKGNMENNELCFVLNTVL